MRPAACGILAVAAAALLPAAAIAQKQCSPGPIDLQRFTARDAPLGAWTEYVTLNGGKQIPAMRFRAFLAEAPWEGKPRRWLELWFDRSGDNAMRVTAQGTPEVVVLKRGKRYFLPPPAAGKAAPVGSCPPPDVSAAFDFVSFRTSAGVFQCRHTREVKNGHAVELWSSDQVHPLQMVKSLYSSGLGYELVGRGSGAASAFPARFAAAPLPTADMLEGLLPVDPHAKKVESRPPAPRPPERPSLLRRRAAGGGGRGRRAGP